MTDIERNNELAKIHIAKKQLGMTDEAYRDMLWTIARVRSAGDLDAAGRKQVISHLRSCGARFKRKHRPTPAAGKKGSINKIKAMLATKQRPDSYADGMARKMFHVDRFEWCTEDQLRRIIAALNYDAKRHKGKNNVN